jgi:hypothetical protein
MSAPVDEYIETRPDDQLGDMTISFGGGVRDFEFILWGENVYFNQGDNTQEK